jgi:hypothetical protein
MPMNPEWLPVMAILFGGMFVCGAALQSFLARKPRRGFALGGAALALIALGLLLGRHGPGAATARPRPLTPASLATARAGNDDADSTSMSLHLGDMTLLVSRSNRYVMSLDGRRFLELKVDRKGLWVTCDVGTRAGGHVRRNRLRYPTEGIPRPDAHTLVLGVQDAEPLRIRYEDPRTIEITGTFFARDRDDPVIFRRGGGVHWTGGGAAAGSTLDLRHFGRGRIDFGRSGLVRIVP